MGSVNLCVKGASRDVVQVRRLSLPPRSHILRLENFAALISGSKHMEARNRSLHDWFTRIRTRQLVLPRFQRFEAWTQRNVAGLLDTVLRDLPAGALLVLEMGEAEPFVSRTMAGAPTDGERIAEHLLDGQQRLTALWRSLTNDYPDRTYFVQIIPDEDDDAISGPPRTVSQGRWTKNGSRYPKWADDPKSVWQRGLIPTSLLRPDSDGEDDFKSWARSASKDNQDGLIDLISLGTELRSRFARYNLPFLQLPSTTPRETALDVFVKMNTSAQPLSTYDIVVAQVEAGTGFSLHELVEELRRDARELEVFADPAQVILNAGALLQDKEPSQTVMLGADFAEGLIDSWDQLVIGTQKAIKFLSEEGVFDASRLPSDPAVPLLVALWAHAPDGLDAEGEARQILRSFLWRAFLTDRYERATNNRRFVDFRLLRSMLTGADDGTPPIFNEASHPLPGVEDILLAGWPKKRDRLARAVLLLTLRNGGLDFADGSPATADNLRSREYHHVFPVALLEKDGLNSESIFRALNCALVTWKTNRNIAAKSPVDYLRQRIDASSIGEGEIRRRLSSHAINYDILTRGAYDEFLQSRAEMLLPLVKDLGHSAIRA